MRQSRTRQSRTSWAGIAAQPGAAAAAADPGAGIGRQSRTRQSRTSWAGIAAQPGAAITDSAIRTSWAAVADRRGNRTAITDSAIPNILGGGAAMPGAAAGLPMFGIGRQSRTRQSRTSWAGIAAQPGAAAPNILGGGGIADVRNRTAITDSAIPNILGRRLPNILGGGAAMPGAAAGLPMFGIGRQSRTRQSRTSWAGIAAQPGAAAAAADCRGSESDGNHGLGNPEHPGPA